MPRRTDTIVEETVTGSPLRRSSRITVTNSPAPITRTRRLSEPPDGISNTEIKTNARGRRGKYIGYSNFP